MQAVTASSSCCYVCLKLPANFSNLSLLQLQPGRNQSVCCAFCCRKLAVAPLQQAPETLQASIDASQQGNFDAVATENVPTIIDDI